MGIGDGLRGVRVRRDGVEVADVAPDRNVRPIGGAPAEGDEDRALYTALIAPVEACLPPGQTVVIEPHESLWLLPFAALRTGDGTPLIERWPLLHAPSLDVLERDPRRAGPGLAGGAHGPPGGQPQDAPGPGDPRREGRAGPAAGRGAGGSRRSPRCSRGDPRVLVGPAANLRTVHGAMRGYDVVHLATHGIAVPDEPLDSCVVLAVPKKDPDRIEVKGFMTVGMILVNVLGRARPIEPPGEAGEALGAEEEWRPTDLVVLSACQTGLGMVTGDGVIGLARAFLVAGARSVVTSLWSVSDAATRVLMVAFYRAYFETGDKALAMQRAMLSVRGIQEFASPRYWAPFMLLERRTAPRRGASPRVARRTDVMAPPVRHAMSGRLIQDAGGIVPHFPMYVLETAVVPSRGEEC